MRRLAAALYVAFITLWVGGLWCVGYLAAPALFATLKAEAWPRGVMESVVENRFAAWHGISSGFSLPRSRLELTLGCCRVGANSYFFRRRRAAVGSPGSANLA